MTVLTVLGAFTTVHIVKTSLYAAPTVHVRTSIHRLIKRTTNRPDCLLLIL